MMRKEDIDRYAAKRPFEPFESGWWTGVDTGSRTWNGSWSVGRRSLPWISEAKSGTSASDL
jgi:hypothetical protein